eukprot:5841095-Prymnesium_polylepis.3
MRAPRGCGTGAARAGDRSTRVARAVHHHQLAIVHHGNPAWFSLSPPSPPWGIPILTGTREGMVPHRDKPA